MRIVTNYWMKPIPLQQFDWSAVTDNYEPDTTLTPCQENASSAPTQKSPSIEQPNLCWSTAVRPSKERLARRCRYGCRRISQVSLPNRSAKRKTASRRSLRNPIRCFDLGLRCPLYFFQLFSCTP
jgi:hypothetical protein